MRNEIKGFLLVLTAAFFWALSGTLAKMMFHNDISPYQLVQVRMFWSGILLWIYLRVKNKELLKIDKEDLMYFIIIGIPGLALLQFTYLFSISQTNVATAIFLQYFAPIFIMIYVLLRKQEEWSTAKIITLILAFIGCFLILFGGENFGLAVNLPGLISGFGSAITFAFYTIYSKKGLKKYNALTILTYGLLFGSVLWSLIIPPWKVFVQGYDFKTYLFFLWIVLFSSILPYSLYTKGISLTLPSTASITALMEPVFAVFMAYMLLGEMLTTLQFVGGMFVLAAVAILQNFEKPKCKPS